MLVEMELREIQIVDDPGRHQVVVLGEKGGPRAFPIYIGLFEASAMDLAVHQEKAPRPMTHDLIYNVLDSLNAQLVEVRVDELRNETFFGKLVVQKEDGEYVLVDSRPSDALILAAKRNVPIFVEDTVLEEVCREDLSGDSEE
ncbi:MAG: bifunctional nuclease family protein [Candidatus Sumerlaeia bacterium]|nr:bifunctional nuclease family protein [Candidatus Sumerlaeia bacterium]